MLAAIFEIVNNFTEPRLKLLKIQNNGIIAASRNMGIKASKGEWIAFLDSDDWWNPYKLQTCIENVNNNIDLIYHDLAIVNGKISFRRRKTRSRQLKKPVIIDLLVNGNPICNSSVMPSQVVLIEFSPFHNICMIGKK